MRRFVRDQLGRFARAAVRLGDTIMEKITLHSPAHRNNGEYVDAGETLTIGTEDDEISEERAKGLVDQHRAVADRSPDGLEEQKVDDLKSLAAAENVELGDATKKADIIAAIRASRTQVQDPA